MLMVRVTDDMYSEVQCYRGYIIVRTTNTTYEYMYEDEYSNARYNNYRCTAYTTSAAQMALESPAARG